VGSEVSKIRTSVNDYVMMYIKKTKKSPWLVVRKRTIPTERPPLVSEASANFCG
jgi:hypothetical protein